MTVILFALVLASAAIKHRDVSLITDIADEDAMHGFTGEDEEVPMVNFEFKFKFRQTDVVTFFSYRVDEPVEEAKQPYHIIEHKDGGMNGPFAESWSQVGQDYLVANILGCKRSGYFVDLAANDAKKLSNTVMLEQHYGWTGLCIEPNAEYHEGLSHRKCLAVDAVVGERTGDTVAWKDEATSGGIVSNETDNKAGATSTRVVTSLLDLFKATKVPTRFDYFSFDVEGAESLIARSFPWDQYTASVITVERPKPDLVLLLQNHGYELLRKNSNFDDETWIHKGLPNFDHVKATYGHWKLPDATPTCVDFGWPSHPAAGIESGIMR